MYTINSIMSFIIILFFPLVAFSVMVMMFYFYLSDRRIIDAFQNFRRRRVTFMMYFMILIFIGMFGMGMSLYVVYFAWDLGIEYFDKPPQGWEGVANRLLMKVGMATALGVFYYILFIAYKEIRSHTIVSMKRYWKSERLLYVDSRQRMREMSDSSTDDAADTYFSKK